MKRMVIILIVSLLVTVRAPVASENTKALDSLLELRGTQYIEKRDMLTSSAATLVAPAPDKRITLLMNIMEQRRDNNALFAKVDEAVQQARSAYAKLSEREKAEETHNRHQELASRLAALRRGNTDALNAAMAEMLWKIAQNDHERLNALRVLSLNSTPVVGVFEAARDILPLTQSVALGQELLDMLAQYAVVYDEGSKAEVIEAVASLSTLLDKDIGFQKYCLKILKTVDAQDAQMVSLAVKTRIQKLTEAESEPQSSTPVMAEPIEIDIRVGPDGSLTTHRVAP